MMGSITIESPDLSGLNLLVSSLNGALTGGLSGDGDLQRVLKTEAGQLAWEIADRLGPSTKDSLNDKVEKDAKKFLDSTYSERSSISKYTVFVDEDQHYSSVSNFTWLTAGPNFLLGINDEDNQPGASGDEALQYIRAGQSSIPRGAAYINLGRRGKKTVLRLNRTRVSQSAFAAAVRKIRDKTGQLKASFAYTAAQLIPAKRVPAWVSRHFSSKANGRAIFNDAGLSSPLEPFIEFGSTAAGVESNPIITAAFSAAVETRKHITKAKLEKVLRGYAYDWNTGRVFHRRESQDQT